MTPHDSTTTLQSPVLLRTIRDTDLDAALRVQAACYPPSMQEAADVVLARICAAGDTSFVAECEGEVCAYVFAYRSRRGAVTTRERAVEGIKFIVGVLGSFGFIIRER